MNIQIGENTYKNNISKDNSIMLGNTYSKDAVSKNDKSGNIEAASAVMFSKGNNDGIKKGDTKEEIMSMASITDAKLSKDYMTVMSHSLSDEDFNKLRENGFEPSKMEPSKMVTIVDEIKATVAKSGKVVEGYNDDLDRDTLEAITGSQVNADAIYDSFKTYDVPLTDGNIKAAEEALSLSESVQNLSDAAMKYMTENNLEPTISNIYMAEHSVAGEDNKTAGGYFSDGSGYLGMSVDGDITSIKDIEEKIDSVIENTGRDADEAGRKLAEKMLDQGMALTEESYDLYKRLSDIEFPMDREAVLDKIASAIKDGKNAVDADLSREESLLEKAARLTDELNNVSEEAINGVVSSGKTLNIRNLTYYEKKVSMGMSFSGQITNDMSAQISRAGRVVAEARLTMTVSATYFIMKNGIDADTTELSKLVDELKEAENRQFESVFGKMRTIDGESVKDIFEDTTRKLDSIRNMPVAAVGTLSISYSSRSILTLNDVYQEGINTKARFDRAGQLYEAMSTEVRSDLGDSIKDAFRNAPDILSELGLEDTKENERAVRILGYNSMEITSENISKVSFVAAKVENVINKLKPANTLEMLREGINPLNISLDGLNERLDNMNSASSDDGSGKNEAERFSEFLYKLDKAHSITKEEREGFIGVYRMINQIEKNDMSSVGALVNSDMELSFKNLMTAVRSRKAKGLDIKLGDENGELDKLITKGLSISDQIDMAVSQESVRIENEDIRRAGELSMQVMDALNEANIPATVNNLLAMDGLLNHKGSMYKAIAKYTDEIEDESEDSFDAVIKDSLDAFDKEDAKEVSDAYSEISQRLMDMINKRALETTDQIDLREMSFSMKQLSLATTLSRDSYYEVPVRIGDAVETVSVSLKHGDNPSIDISLESAIYGKIKGTFDLAGDALEGLFMVDGANAKENIQGKKNELMDKLAEKEIPVRDINFVHSMGVKTNIFGEKTDNNNVGKDAVSTKMLFEVTKTFIQVLAS